MRVKIRCGTGRDLNTVYVRQDETKLRNYFKNHEHIPVFSDIACTNQIGIAGRSSISLEKIGSISLGDDVYCPYTLDAPIGGTGKVLFIRPCSDSGEDVLVEFDSWHGGHNGSGMGARDKCWYVASKKTYKILTKGDYDNMDKKVVSILAWNEEYNVMCIEYNDKLYCINEEDISKFDIKCVVCGNIHNFSDLEYVEGYGFICNDCKDNFEVCEDCGEKVLKGSLTEINGRKICKKCREKYIICDHCGGWVLRGDTVSVNSGEQTLCHNCVNEMVEEHTIVECYRCLEYFTQDNIHSDNGHSYCSDCYSQRFEDYIDGYHGSRDPRFKSLRSDKSHPLSSNMYIGVEHELSNVGTNNGLLARTLCEDFHRKCEHDSSINSGFECISDALTFAYWKKHEDIPAYMKACVDGGLEPDESSGIHVHISRTPLTDTQTANIGIFVMNNYNKCIKFGRRPADTGYLEYCGPKKFRSLNPSSVINSLDDHYLAVNLEEYSNIELRFFMTTDDASHFEAIIEFAHCLASVAAMDEEQITWERLYDFAKQDGKCENFIKEYDNDFNHYSIDDYDYDNFDFYCA